METLETLLSREQEITVHTLASLMNRHSRKNWKSVLDENQQVFADAFRKLGEPAYGQFGRMLFGPVIGEMERAGFTLESEHLASSVEYWGPPEERERCMWFVVKKDGSPLGSLVTRVFHDHTQFRIPRSPDVFALESTERDEIVAALSRASVRMRKYNEFTGTFSMDITESGEQSENGWEYGVEVGIKDYLETDNPEVIQSMLDHALALWGRYNWELISVAPCQDRLIAFFRRPKSREKAETV
jgi:hypothetical protein